MNPQKSPLSGYDPSDYCTTREAAKILGTSLRTIQLWVESGILQAWKTPGGRRRVTRESMQQRGERRTSTWVTQAVFRRMLTTRKECTPVLPGQIG